jgi:hypothetical protein
LEKIIGIEKYAGKVRKEYVLIDKHFGTFSKFFTYLYDSSFRESDFTFFV